ncbi:MAG: RidA family protein [Burkholderiaceae bacterium]|jgi:enamine deaminase RidA (YjgF/YER057c/UK114 family)|nr:MAG: RidA family protein [Burkholderiaceae bacterium]
MPVEKINPVGLTRPVGYHHVTVSTGTRTICVAGQTAHNVDGEVVGLGDLATQIEQTYANVVTALEGAGATFADVAKLTMYVVGWSVDQLPALSDGIGRAAARLQIDPRSALTLVGVQALVEPDLLVEIEAVAVLP